MNNYLFKTNLNCGNCVAKVEKSLNEIANNGWRVEIEKPEKYLHINTQESPDLVIELIAEKGFTATLVKA